MICRRPAVFSDLLNDAVAERSAGPLLMISIRRGPEAGIDPSSGDGPGMESIVHHG
jgi:hypothetical protein